MLTQTPHFVLGAINSDIDVVLDVHVYIVCLSLYRVNDHSEYMYV